MSKITGQEKPDAGMTLIKVGGIMMASGCLIMVAVPVLLVVFLILLSVIGGCI